MLPNLERLNRFRILVVEENETVRKSLEQQLTAWHMRAHTSASPAEAVSWLKQAQEEGDPYRLLLLDAGIEEEAREGLIREVATDPLLQDTKTILLVPLDYQMPAEEDGASAVFATVSKPVKQSLLYQAIMKSSGGAVANETSTQRVRRTARVATHMTSRALPFSGLRILVAEDNPVNQRVTVGQLRQLGIQAEAVANGEEVLRVTEGIPYPIILMDCQMPEMDGYEATRQLRAREARGHPRTYIIALTANAMVGDRQRCLEAGMDDYLAKPVKPDLLQETIRRALGSIPVQNVQTAIAMPASEAAVDRELVLSLRSLGDGDGTDMVVELIRVFLEDIHARVESLRNALAVGDWEAIRRTAHSIKGSSANFGAHTLVELARQTESGISSGNADGLPGLVEAIAAETHRVHGELHQIATELAPS